MLSISRRGDMLTLIADPPEQVRFRHPNGTFYPNRAGRRVGTGAELWLIEVEPGLSLRFQHLVGTEWVDAAEDE